MKNADRAEKAYRCVLGYEDDSSIEECISDLLGDLRHLCDQSGYDYAERDGVGYRNYLAELEEERTAEPAYTVIGIYRANDGERYATTVYTHNGPEAAEQLAQEACREDNRAETGEDLIEIAAVIEGEVRVTA